MIKGIQLEAQLFPSRKAASGGVVTMNFVKAPPPRPLSQKETLDSLEHWKAIFRNYIGVLVHKFSLFWWLR